MNTTPNAPDASDSSAGESADRLLFSLSALREISDLLTSEGDFDRASDAVLRTVWALWQPRGGAAPLRRGRATPPRLGCAGKGLPSEVAAEGPLRDLLTSAQGPLVFDGSGDWPEAL